MITITAVLLLIAMLFMMFPFVLMFMNNLSKIKDTLTFEKQNRAKKALIYMPIISLVLIALAIGVAFI